MSENSAITFCDATFNPWWGCVKVSPGCQFCYAESFSRRLGENLWGAAASRKFFGEKHWGEPRRWVKRLTAKLGRRPRVFCASMADVFEDFGEEIEAARQNLWVLIEETPGMDWMLLTKRPENIMEMVPVRWHGGFPEHVWIVATTENQEMVDLRVPILLKVPARVRGLSVGPMIGPVDVRQALTYGHDIEESGAPALARLNGINWVICEGESGTHARPMHPAWPRSLRDQCIGAGVPFHFKQHGEWIGLDDIERTNLSTPVLSDLDDFFRDHVFRHGGTGGVVGAVVYRVGKKTAGRLLDGKLWDEYPT